MLGLIVNLAAILTGSLIGTAAGKRISSTVSEKVLAAIGLCVFFIGVTGLFTDANSIVILLAFAVGTLIGAGIDLDGKLDRAGRRAAVFLSERFAPAAAGRGKAGAASGSDIVKDSAKGGARTGGAAGEAPDVAALAEGRPIDAAAADGLGDTGRAEGSDAADTAASGDKYIDQALSTETAEKPAAARTLHDHVNGGMTFFLISCTGAYTITACFTAGMGDNTMLYIKAILDLVVSMTMAAGMGMGIALSIIPMLIYQGILILCAGFLAPLLSGTMIAALSCTGSLITVAIGTDMIGATHLKPVNYLPAIVLAPVFQYIADLLLA